MESAFYYLGISDAIPDKYYIATDRDSTKLNISTVEQYFLKKDILSIGLQKIEHSGINIPIYSKERMLIEVIRYSKRLPYDYYKEIIAYYRNHIYEIDIPLVIEYIEKFPKSELIRDKLEKEVL